MKMTERQRILALDAAACAAECISDKNLAAACALLQDELDVYFGKHPKPDDFEDFLKEQLEAVEILAKSPETFGAI